MKIMIFILFVTLTINSAMGAVKPLDSNLPKPSFSEKNTNDSSVELRKLLEQGQAGEFFKRATTEFSRICAFESRGETPSEEDGKALLWIYYSIANTPLLAMDSTENARWAADNRDADLRLKEYAISILAIDRCRDLIPQDKGTNQLFASYGAGIVRDFRNQIRAKTYSDKRIIIPEEDIRASTKRSLKIMLEEQPRELMNKRLREERERSQNDRLKVNMQNRRNDQMKNIIESAEKDFMILLVDLFPGKTGEVRKYIKMAGYTDQEIHDLVDRTVGRDKETEFLYKGRSKRR